MSSNELKNLKQGYIKTQLSEETVSKDPINQFKQWYAEAEKSEVLEPSASILSTADKNSFPSARTVLLKGVEERGFVFYTNYISKKAKDLSENPNASLLFLWKELERQVRIEGKVEKVSGQDSEKYFHSRPKESQISAWVSVQSSIIPDRKYLDDKFEEYNKKFGDGEIPLPDYWGGYILLPLYFEFWQGRENRLHDRICYKKENKGWKIFRLAP